MKKKILGKPIKNFGQGGGFWWVGRVTPNIDFFNDGPDNKFGLLTGYTYEIYKLT